jgi:glycosyltransferase involved in cell wall biosynthesis
MPKLSILVPVYYNEKNLPTTIPALQAVLDTLPGMEGELVFVDDGSGDGSFGVLSSYAAQDPRIKVVRLCRNFGAYMALLAGLNHATGDAIAIIMADLQDPPELIPEMVSKWKEGSKLVLAERTDREDAFIDRLFANAFWGFIRRFGIKTIPPGGFDFVLFDRCIADILRTMREKNSHFMLQTVWTGFPPAVIPYTRRKRTVGKSRWTFSKKLKLFIDSSIAFSFIPIRVMSLAGAITALAGFAWALYVLVSWARFGISVQGYASLMMTLLVIGGLQMLMMGIIGEYIWRTFDETRRRPAYIVAEKLNLPTTSSERQPRAHPQHLPHPGDGHRDNQAA